MPRLLSKDVLALSDEDFAFECSIVKEVQRFDIYEVIQYRDLNFIKKVLPLMIALNPAEVNDDVRYWQLAALQDASTSKDSGDVQTLAKIALEFSGALLQTDRILNADDKITPVSKEEQLKKVNADSAALEELLATSDYGHNLRCTIEGLLAEIQRPGKTGLFLVKVPR